MTTQRDAGNGDRRGSTFAQAPALSLPKGGGAVRGIGEAFRANPATGTATLSVPIAQMSAGRGLDPHVALSYDSGSGNGPFGLGWSIAVPSIARKTDKRLPRYRDAIDGDVYLLSEAEDLVPSLRKVGADWLIDEDQRVVAGDEFAIRRYRPRIESGFDRIERWTVSATGEIHWRTIDRHNVTSIFGRDGSGRVADPDDPTRVFRWLLQERRDDRGNVIAYVFKPEDLDNVDPVHVYERNRIGRPTSNRYIKRVQYANSAPGVAADWHFELVFDYGEHDDATPGAVESTTWPVRPDPFGTGRPGWDLRTYRRCRRILAFNRFAELGPDPVLVRSTDLTYEDDPAGSRLTSITHAGYSPQGAALVRRALPPLELEYTIPIVDPTVRDLDAASAENLPRGIDGDTYQFTDLDSEGLPGILSERDGAWWYKRNLGRGVFGRAELVPALPVPVHSSGGRINLADLESDGRKFLVDDRSQAGGSF